LQKRYLDKEGSSLEFLDYKINYAGWLFHAEKYDSATYYYQNALSEYHALNDTIGMINQFKNLGIVATEQENIELALNYFLKAEAYSKAIDFESYIIAKRLHQAYSSLKQYDSAYYYLRLHKQLEDSTFTEEQANHLNLLRTVHEVEATNRQKQLLAANNRALMISLIFAGAIALSLLFGLYLNQRKRKVEKSLLLEREASLQNEMISQLHIQESEAIQRINRKLEEEYQKVARTLHDQLGNLLVTARLNIQGLIDQLPAQSANSQQQFQVADQSLENALQAIRQIAHQMHEGRINQLGLTSVLKELKSTVEASGKLKVELDLIGVEQRLEAQHERLVFQIIRELTTNVIKYAQATELSIQVVREADQIEIMISDNGQGFPSDFSPQQYGLGLRSVQADLDKSGGSLEIDSQPNHGATIIIDLPV
ncbi:MAG: ATP-binding protein, partial [Bacteroidota bacterium]